DRALRVRLRCELKQAMPRSERRRSPQNVPSSHCHPFVRKQLIEFFLGRGSGPYSPGRPRDLPKGTNCRRSYPIPEAGLRLELVAPPRSVNSQLPKPADCFPTPRLQNSDAAARSSNRRSAAALTVWDVGLKASDIANAWEAVHRRSFENFKL